MDACKECMAHSGIEAEIQNAKDDIKRVEEGVESLRKFMIGTLASAVLSLFGIVVILLRTIN